MIKSLRKILLAAAVLTALSAVPAYAAGWQNDGNGWWWKNDDGTRPVNQWMWVDGNFDGTAECCYFDSNGYRMENTVTPDGCTVNSDGFWVENGVVKTRTEENAGFGITQHTMKTSETDSFQYYLYTPKDATENMPLILYLHSGVPRGSGMEKIKDEDLVTYLLGAGKESVPAYVVMPYVSSKKKSWPNYGDSLVELVNAVADEYKIDKNRISIAGWSMGADGLNKVLGGHIDTFSCAVWISPFSRGTGQSFDTAQSDLMATIPHWFIHEEDQFVRTNVEEAVQAINTSRGNAVSTEIPGVTHSTLLLFQHGEADPYGVINWLISHRRGEKA